MRSWGDLTTKEKEFFDRQLRLRHELSTENRYEIEVLKVNMICGPLSVAEMNRFEYLLDLANKNARQTIAR